MCSPSARRRHQHHTIGMPAAQRTCGAMEQLLGQVGAGMEQALPGVAALDVGGVKRRSGPFAGMPSPRQVSMWSDAYMTLIGHTLGARCDHHQRYRLRW